MPHYYSEKQDSKLRLKKIFFNIGSLRLSFITGSGTFSINKVDRGSEVLIEYARIDENKRVLDIGAGYGAIGISVAILNPSCTIMMSEINERAAELTKENIKLNKVSNAVIVRGNLFDKVEGNFDYVLSNPPQSAGKDICFQIIEGAKARLNPGGILYLVARKNKGGDTLSAKMQEVFGNLEVLAKKSGYWVYCSKVL
jgi:16S rRNA (guanine1207-N2)-methyltransferase